MKSVCPRFALGVPGGASGCERSSSSDGFGGYVSAITKSLNADISLSGSCVARPIRLTNAGLNAERSARSPRQWNGVVFASPRSVCVVIGPFIGSKPWRPGGFGGVGGGGANEPVGFPRSQAWPSMSPNRWQLAHD